MRTHLLDEHFHFFQDHQSLELEGIFSAKDLVLLEEGLASLKPQAHSRKTLEPTRPEIRHDVWRNIAPLKKIVFHKGLCEVVYRLQQTRPLRIGYDRYLPPEIPPVSTGDASLQSLSSLRPLICGAFIALRDSEPKQKDLFFPQKKGDVLFVHPDFPIPWQLLHNDQANDYYLVVYVGSKTAYARNAQDPFTGTFIQSGYSNGDRLSDVKNPIVY